VSDPTDITKEQAATAVRKAAWRVEDLDRQDYGRVLIHTYRGPFGADGPDPCPVCGPEATDA